MFINSIVYYNDNLAQVSLLYSTAPETFPTSSTGLEGFKQGVTFAPGSMIYVTGTSKMYMLSPDSEWVEQ